MIRASFTCVYSPERGDTRATDLAPINDNQADFSHYHYQAIYHLIYGRLLSTIDKHDHSIANHNFMRDFKYFRSYKEKNNNNIINEALKWKFGVNALLSNYNIYNYIQILFTIGEKREREKRE